MSDEPLSTFERMAWWTLALFIILAAYQTLHYATAEMVVHTDRFHRFEYDQHVIRGKPIPGWAEPFFWPAERINELIHPDDHKWHNPMG